MKLPRVDETITYRGRDYRVAEVDPGATHPVCVFDFDARRGFSRVWLPREAFAGRP